jgi:hypothetical protein
VTCSNNKAGPGQTNLLLKVCDETLHVGVDIWVVGGVGQLFFLGHHFLKIGQNLVILGLDVSVLLVSLITGTYQLIQQ